MWGHNLKLETHTETHIYRLREKIKKNFNDNNFILSSSWDTRFQKMNQSLIDNLISKAFEKIM